MKKSCTILGICCLVAFNSVAQEISLSQLSMPSSPGWVLADKAPGSIEKPTTPRAFGVSLLNLLQGSAVEVTPFWLTSKPDLEYSDWIRKKSLFIETLNLSAATFKTDTNSHLSVGLRTQVIRIYSREQIKRLQEQEDKIIDLLVTRDNSGNLDLAAIAKAHDQLEKIQNRGMFSVELAGAYLGNSSTFTFKDLQSSKAGVWSNIRWSPVKSQLDFVALARYAWSVNTSTDSTFLDYGLSLNYETVKFNIAIEYVNRRNITAHSNDNRIALLANYQINKNLAIVASMGKNFDTEHTIFTLFGLNISLAPPQTPISGDEE
jgi:hypothetical protein